MHSLFTRWQTHVTYDFETELKEYDEKMETTATKVTQIVVSSVAVVLLLILLFNQREKLVLHDPRNFFKDSKTIRAKKSFLHPIHQERSEHLWKMCQEDNIPTSPDVPEHIQYVLSNRAISNQYLMQEYLPKKCFYFQMAFCVVPKAGLTTLNKYQSVTNI